MNVRRQLRLQLRQFNIDLLCDPLDVILGDQIPVVVDDALVFETERDTRHQSRYLCSRVPERIDGNSPA